LRDGRCAEHLQISDNNEEFGFKPFTGRLRTEDISVGGQYAELAVSATRTKDLDNPNYGLNSDATRHTLINPFVTMLTTADPPLELSVAGENAHSPQGVSDDLAAAMTVHALGYDAGIPLNVIRVYNPPLTDYAKYLVEQANGTGGSCYDFRDDKGDKHEYPAYCQMLTQMFAKVYSDHLLVRVSDGEYEFKNIPTAEDGVVVTKNSTSVEDYDSTADASNPDTAVILKQDIYPPRVAAPTTAGSYVMDSVSINGQTAGNIYMPSGGTTLIQFYAWASPNQMPLRRVAVRKGDGTDPVSVESESLSNKKPMCGSKLCWEEGGFDWTLPSESSLMSCNTDSDCSSLGSGSWNCEDVSGYKTFGSTEEYGCKAEPYEFVVDYSCPSAGGEGTKVYITTAASYGINWVNDIQANYGDITYVCVFEPKVQALDNWGWCTGNCKSTNLNGRYGSTYVKSDGCYQDWSFQDCEMIKSSPWVNYDGHLVVVPMP
jgi:hypothetical protein